jgi:hypothetical protein
MDTVLFTRFEPFIRNFDQTSLAPLLLDRDGALSIYYAPFDYINSAAKLVLVGITPGRQQMISALAEAKRQLQLGNSAELTCKEGFEIDLIAGELS